MGKEREAKMKKAQKVFRQLIKNRVREPFVVLNSEQYKNKATRDACKSAGFDVYENKSSMKVLILGSTGMLGSMVLKYLSKKDLEIAAPSRKEINKIHPKNYDYIINCIGIIKQKLDNPKEAIEINSIFPYTISEKAPNAKIIQIATDCVFSGESGFYLEDNEHDASDIYGKTKSLGEVQAKNFYNIRTSIIGPIKRKRKVSLLEWFLSQKKNATIKGYTNHFWNGITTLHFAKLCYAIIEKKRQIPNLLHFIPSGAVNKYELLQIFAKKFNRMDIKIRPTKADYCNRILKTDNILIVNNLWRDMGYKKPPTIKEMIDEL